MYLVNVLVNFCNHCFFPVFACGWENVDAKPDKLLVCDRKSIGSENICSNESCLSANVLEVVFLSQVYFYT